MTSNNTQQQQQQQPTRINLDEELNQEKALSILIQGVNLAQSKGVYSFEEAEIISKCVRRFTTPPNQQTPNQQTPTTNPSTTTIPTSTPTVASTEPEMVVL